MSEQEHSCPDCPDTSSFDKVLQTGSPLFHGWAKAAKEQAIGAHKFTLAADKYIKER